MKTPPRAARPRSPRRTGHFLERRAGRGSWPATPRLEVAVRSNGADASAARRRDVSSPTRANLQMSCRCRPAGVLPIVPPPRCAGATRDSFLAMPARSKRSLAALAQHAAAKKPKLEPEKPPPQSMKRCRFIDCGEAGRVRLAAAARGRDQVHAAARPDGRRLASLGRRLLGGAKACGHLWGKLAVGLAAVGVVFG